MSTDGITWFKASRRKLVAMVAGVAILAGAAGAVLPEQEAVGSVTVEQVEFELLSASEEPRDAELEQLARKRRNRNSFQNTVVPFSGASVNSTWS